MPPNVLPIILIVVVVFFPLLVGVGLASYFGSLWLRALLSGAQVSLMQLVGARLRGSDVRLLVDAYVALRHSDRPELREITFARLESLYLQHRHRMTIGDDLVRMVREGKSDR